MGGFYGTVITAKKATPYVQRALEAGEPPEGLHVTGFSIPADCRLKDRARVSVMLKQGDEPAICVCTLCVGGNDSMLVSITLEEYVELSLVGPAAAVVHMHGAFVPHEGGVEDEEDEEADSDDENLTAAQMMEKQLNQLIGQPSGLGGAQGGGGGGAGDESDDDESDDESEDEEEEAEGEGAELATGEKIVTRFSGSKHVEITDLDSGEKLNTQTVMVTEETQNGEAQMGAAEASSSEDESDDEEANAVPEASRGTVAAADAEDDEESDEEDAEDGTGGSEDEESSSGEEGGAPAAAAPIAAANGKRKASEGIEPSAKRAKRTKFANGFEVSELQQSSDPKAPVAKPGMRVAMRYTGTLQSNGKVFDQTKGKKTFNFRLGVGEVIKGWDKGVAGMRVGDKRRLVVPPSMAYGDTGVKGVIPRNATLCFDVELCRVQGGTQ